MVHGCICIKCICRMSFRFHFFCKYFSIQFQIAKMFSMSFLHVAFDKRLNSSQKSNLNLEYLESIFGKHRKMTKTIIECATNANRYSKCIELPMCVVKLDWCHWAQQLFAWLKNCSLRYNGKFQESLRIIWRNRNKYGWTMIHHVILYNQYKLDWFGTAPIRFSSKFHQFH